jgi:hypothetical protein
METQAMGCGSDLSSSRSFLMGVGCGSCQTRPDSSSDYEEACVALPTVAGAAANNDGE